jgi:AcrR family transcriptional regulator
MQSESQLNTETEKAKPIKRKRRTHKERTDMSDSKMFEAAEALILDVGTQNLTLKEVGERAGYSRGLANARFGNKENLFLKLAERCQGIWLNQVANYTEGKSGLAALMSRLDAAAEYAREFPNDARVLYILWFESVGASSDMKDGLSKFHKNANKDIGFLIEEAKEKGDISKSIDSEELALAITSMMFGLCYQFVVSPDSINLPNSVAKFKETITRLIESF